MGFTSRNIAVTLKLPKFGRKTAFKIFNNLKFNISSREDLFEYLRDCEIDLKTPKVSKSDFDIAYRSIENLEYDNSRLNIEIVDYYDTRYPSRFKNETDPPILLFCKGNIDLLNSERNVAIIGTREPYASAYKLGFNAAFAFATEGFNIVSGLAIGCDSAGHKGALEANGKTTAFLAHGLHTVYPKENKELAESIVDKDGLLVSEYMTGTQAFKTQFVERDRLQSYLSDGVLVVQTDVNGGTMHAVRVAVNSRKPIGVIYPELMDFRLHQKSKGNFMIINDFKGSPIVTKNDLTDFIYKLSGSDVNVYLKNPPLLFSDTAKSMVSSVSASKSDSALRVYDENSTVVHESKENLEHYKKVDDTSSMRKEILELKQRVENLENMFSSLVKAQSKTKTSKKKSSKSTDEIRSDF
jgi:DNA processing protein